MLASCFKAVAADEEENEGEEGEGKNEAEEEEDDEEVRADRRSKIERSLLAAPCDI